MKAKSLMHEILGAMARQNTTQAEQLGQRQRNVNSSSPSAGTAPPCSVMPEQNLCLFSSECREGYRSAPVHSGERVTKGIIYDVHLPESWDSCLFFHLSIPQTESFQRLIQFSFSVLTEQKVPRPVCECFEYIAGVPVFKHPVNLWQHEPQLNTVVSTQTLHPSTFR